MTVDELVRLDELTITTIEGEVITYTRIKGGYWGASHLFRLQREPENEAQIQFQDLRAQV